MGVIPPIGEAAWQAEFLKYQASPEYLKINLGMSLAEFKGIFYWEYGHRVLGRLIGIIYLLPLLFFVAKGWVAKEWRGRFFGLFLLGGLQGLMGWYMVKSGLVDVPQVSQYRLTAHLGLALIIFSLMLWFAMDFLRGSGTSVNSTKRYRAATAWSVCLVLLMMLSGGFVAGTKAGHIMNTFPLMGGRWIPLDWLAMQPTWRNFFENAITIQFTHRCLAVLVFCIISYTAIHASKQSFNTRFTWVVAIMLVQISLGILALIHHVPIILGAAHQAGAVALLSATLLAAHVARKQG